MFLVHSSQSTVKPFTKANMTPSERAAIVAIAWVYFDKRELRNGNRIEVKPVTPKGAKRLFRVEKKGLFITHSDGEIELHDETKDFKIYNERAIKENNVKIEHNERYNTIYFTDMSSTRIKGKDDDGSFEVRTETYKWVKVIDESYGKSFKYFIEIHL